MVYDVTSAKDVSYTEVIFRTSPLQWSRTRRLKLLSNQMLFQPLVEQLDENNNINNSNTSQLHINGPFWKHKW